MIKWIRNLVRSRRDPAPAPSIHPESLNQARAQAARADEALRWVEAQDPVVERTSERAARIHRANNLGPAFMHVLRGGKDAGSA